MLSVVIPALDQVVPTGRIVGLARELQGAIAALWRRLDADDDRELPF